MMTDRRFLKYFLLILGFYCLFVSGANAGSPFWSMHVGNYWEYSGSCSPPCDPWTWRNEVAAFDTTTCPVPTYRWDGNEVGLSVEEKTWFEVAPTYLKGWRLEINDDVFGWTAIIPSAGYTILNNPITVPSNWTDNTTGNVIVGSQTYSGLSMSSTVNVLSYENVTVDLGTYKAYKLRHTLSVPDLDLSRIQDLWIVPYLGVVRIDTVGDGETETLTSMKIRKPIFDRDGDARTDVAIYDTGAGVWWIKPSSGAPAYGVGWGGPGFSPVPGDYDGDGIADIAIYDTSAGVWWISPSGAPAYGVGWGGTGFTAVAGDYDGDGIADIAIYDTSTGAWWIKPSSGAPAYGEGWGGTGFTPVAGDYDGDGIADIAIYGTSSGAWWVQPSSGASAYGVGWGGTGFTPVPGDYDGDGRTDIAIYGTSSGAWWVKPSSGASAYGVGWGGTGFTPVPGDYDGDGRTDIAIYGTSSGAWWVQPSSGASAYGVGWGGPGYVPVTK